VVKIPVNLDKETAEQIRNHYEHAILNIGPEEHNYVLSKIDNKISILLKSRDSWKIKLANRALRLLKLYKKRLQRKKPVFDEDMNKIVAGLFYFCNPYDIVPDYVPGVGLIDDAYVLDLCLRSLTKKR
jgi:uncharacterized membrane protein YkvA (DUF1232 family)